MAERNLTAVFLDRRARARLRPPGLWSKGTGGDNREETGSLLLDGREGSRAGQEVSRRNYPRGKRRHCAVCGAPERRVKSSLEVASEYIAPWQPRVEALASWWSGGSSANMPEDAASSSSSSSFAGAPGEDSVVGGRDNGIDTSTSDTSGKEQRFLPKGDAEVAGGTDDEGVELMRCRRQGCFLLVCRRGKMPCHGFQVPVDIIDAYMSELAQRREAAGVSPQQVLPTEASQFDETVGEQVAQVVSTAGGAASHALWDLSSRAIEAASDRYHGGGGKKGEVRLSHVVPTADTPTVECCRSCWQGSSLLLLRRTRAAKVREQQRALGELRQAVVATYALLAAKVAEIQALKKSVTERARFARLESGFRVLAAGATEGEPDQAEEAERESGSRLLVDLSASERARLDRVRGQLADRQAALRPLQTRHEQATQALSRGLRRAASCGDSAVEDSKRVRAVSANCNKCWCLICDEVVLALRPPVVTQGCRAVSQDGGNTRVVDDSPGASSFRPESPAVPPPVLWSES